MITITLSLAVTWQPVVLAVLHLAVVLVVVAKARPEDLPAILETLSRWFRPR
jgi:hypothetical protein